MRRPYYTEHGITLYHEDCLTVMRALEPNSIDAIVTDPPYGLTQNKKGGSGEKSLNVNSPAGRSRITTGGFMGMHWDHGVPDSTYWCEALRVAKPGAHALIFGGDRTHHRLMVAIEDAGWEIRTCIYWIFGSGFPKSLNVSKAIDKMAGAKRENDGGMTSAPNGKPGGYIGERYKQKRLTRFGVVQDQPDKTIPATDYAKDWDGWGTALKPAVEIIIVARKPLEGTVAQNVLKWGTGAMNIDGCRVPGVPEPTRFDPIKHSHVGYRMTATGADCAANASPLGRWPANLIHDGSDEVLAAFPNAPGQIADAKIDPTGRKTQNIYGALKQWAEVKGECWKETP